MTTTPRVDALIDSVTAGTPEFYATVYDDLASLACDLEAEVTLLRKVAYAAETMRYSNTAKAVRAFDAALAAWEDE